MLLDAGPKKSHLLLHVYLYATLKPVLGEEAE